jgi:hypothetical protein
MLMTGSDERGVVAIEKLTKQKFEIASLVVERSPRESREPREPRESRERRDRNERPARGEGESRSSARTPAAPVDDFFSKPYEASAAEATPASRPVEPSVSITREKPARVAALLGGSKR